jgi:hypothetical protein
MTTLALPELVHWPSKTKNGGRTTIIGSTADAVALGRNYVQTRRDDLIEMRNKGVAKVHVRVRYRDSGKTKSKTVSISHHENDWEKRFDEYELAAREITLGNPAIKHQISELATLLMHMALEVAPSIASAYCGFERWEEGDEVLPDLLREGDDRPFLRRKRGEQEAKGGKGEGAYRIIINTDVAWWGTPEMNAGVMGALVLVLQQFAPVEIWIQQGWLGSQADDGVSLFKLDFNGSFDPTQLSFWTGSAFKDIPFSNFINKSIGRESNNTAVHAELPCDLYLRGDWMTKSGIQHGFKHLPKTEQQTLAAKWIAETCNGILYGEEAEEQK